MKKVISAVLCIVMSALVLTACQAPDEFSDGERLSDNYERSSDVSKTFNFSDGADTPPQAYTVYASSVTDFELRMFRNYYQQNKDKSFVFSPSLTTLNLGMLMNGASGETKDELSLVISKDVTEDNFNACSSYFQSRMQAVSLMGSEQSSDNTENDGKTAVSNTVAFDSSMFINDTADIKSAFLQANSNFYGGDIFRFVFGDEYSASKVNNQLNLGGKKAFKSIDKNMSMFTVSSSNIVDEWLEPYAQSDIKQGTFKSDNGEKTVSFMTSSESYLKTEKAQAIVKYTKDNPLKLLLILPNEKISLEDYIGNLTNLEYSNLITSLDITKKAKAVIPEFSIASCDSLTPLSPVLSKSGLNSLFTDAATFKSASNDRDFRINEIYEDTPDFSLNAYGIGKEDDKTLMQKRTKEQAKTDVEVKFDRPFIFMLIDNESEIPVYIGTVNN